MNFSVNSSDLMAHMTAVSRIMASKNALPILDCILFNLSEDTLELTASDSENSMISVLHVSESSGSGMIALPAKLLIETFKNLSDQIVTFNIDLESFAVKFTAGRYKTSFNGFDAAAYPRPKELAEGSHSFTIQAQQLLTGISRTLFAASTDTLRPVMMGLNMEISSDKLLLAATNSHILSQVEVPIVESSEECKVIMPNKTANLLKNLLAKEGEDAIITFDKTNIRIDLNAFTLICRQIEGTYPNYKNAISHQFTREVIIDRQMLVSAVRLTAPYADKGNSLIKVVISGNEFTISSQDSDYSTAAEDTISCSLSGADITIGFKYNFMLDIFTNIETEEVMIKIESDTKGVIVEPIFKSSEDGEDTSEQYEMTCLLMPMNIA